MYLNGVEIARDNLPAGSLSPTTFASGSITGTAESTWNEFTIPGNLLVSGTNTIAAEVHQDTNNNVDSTFDAELISKPPVETNPPSRPTINLGNVTGSTVDLSWAPSTDDSSIMGYALRRNGSLISYGSATSFTDTGLAPTSQYSYQVTAIDSSGNASTPAGIAVSTTRNGGLVNFHDGWNYTFDGVNQGTAWIAPSFDDSSWGGGAGELGVGDGDEATVIGPATAPTPITAYFRKTFEAHDLDAITALTLNVVRDDGFVAYLNGVEIGRNNMPAGTVTYSTRPLVGIGDRLDETTPVTLTVPQSALIDGDNVLAVEMHQFNNTSTDLSFDATLQATYAAAPVLTLDAPTTGSYVATPTTTFSGLCTTAAGTVTVDVAGNTPALFTAPCENNEFSATGALEDGGYSASASQSSTLVGVSNGIDFIVDTSVPEVAITSPTEGSLSATPNPTLSGTCTDAAGTVRIALTGTSSANLNTPCTAGAWSVTSAVLATGPYTASASQRNLAGTTGTSTAVNFSVDSTAPTTTDDSATIGNAWRTTAATVHLTPADTGGAGVAQTYYTTNGTDPTTASATGTSIDLTTDGVYTIKYFSVDAVGNAEPVTTAGTQIRIDTAVPVTTDNTGSFVNWTNQNATVTLTPTDAGQVAATYYTTNGSTPTTASPQGTSISLTAAGTYTVKYFSVDAAGNAEAVQTAATPIRIDKTAPTTTDNTASIGNAWKLTTQTVTLTPSDTGGSGVQTTYYTTNGSTPTTASAQGTSVVLSDPGTYSIKYFSADAAGNTETVKTAGTQIRIDTSVPTNAIQFPADGGRYNSTTWSAGGCSLGTSRICGTATDTGSGVSSNRVSVQRSSDNRWWSGSTWQTSQTSVTASGTTTWAIQLATSQLTNGTSYTVTSWTLDAAGNQSANSVRTFVYDTSGPTTTGSSLVTTNKNGAIDVGDTFTVTFNEAINPSSVPASSTLAMSRSFSNTSYSISGLTDGSRTTGASGYVTSSISTRTLNYAGTLALSNDNQTITFTVTGTCTGSSCGSATTSPSSGTYQYKPDTDLRDLAGNAPSTTTVNASSSQVIF